MNRKVVLVVVPSLFGGGAERVMVHLVNNLDRERFKPVLALGSVSGPYLGDVRGDVPVHNLGAERARAAMPAVIKTVRKWRPDIVLSTLGMNFAVAAARPFFPRGTRVLLREGNSVTAFLKDVARTGRARAWLMRAVYRRVYGLADRVICQCDYMRADVAANLGLPESRLVRIYNPVDIPRVRDLASRERAEFPGLGPHLITVGKLDYQKGYDILLEALPAVRRRHPGATLTILGDGPDRAALEGHSAALGLAEAVRFLGFQANPYPFMQAADLFISSSRYEGFANVILEAMACGTPVVATDCPGGNREVVEEGTTGWLARVEDSASLAETTAEALDHRAELDRELIRRQCEARFSIGQILAMYEACFLA